MAAELHVYSTFWLQGRGDLLTVALRRRRRGAGTDPETPISAFLPPLVARFVADIRQHEIEHVASFCHRLSMVRLRTCTGARIRLLDISWYWCCLAGSWRLELLVML